MDVLHTDINLIADSLGLSNAFLTSHDVVDDWEGGFVDNSIDPGGPTNYGITVSLARKHGYEGKIFDLPPKLALEIFHEEFWVKHNLESLAKTDLATAQTVYDQLILHGKEYGIEWMQWCLGERMDGVVGHATLRAVRKVEEKDRLHNCQRARQIRLMINIVRNKPPQRAFLDGWLRRAFQQWRWWDSNPLYHS